MQFPGPVIPVTDCRRQYALLAERIEAAMAEVGSSGTYLRGEQTRAFEEELAAYCGVPQVIGVGNGTDALELALRAVGCGPGDEVALVANAGMYAAAAAVLTGATPVFADVDDSSLLLCVDSLERVLSERTRAVVVTHLYGRMCDVAAVRKAVAGRDIVIIEDCAQALGARSAAGPAGSLGDLAAFSFYPTKNLGALGDAGAVATRHDDLAQRVRQLCQYGWSDRFHAVLPGGRNSRMDEIQAAVLRIKLPLLEEWNRLRRAIVARYVDAAEGTGLSIVQSPTEAFTAHLCVARHPRRAEVRQWLWEQGVSTAIHYPVPDHRQPALGTVGWRADRLDVTETAVSEILTLPCFPEMTPREVDHVCRCLRSLKLD